jgi:sulfur-carrier protein adenylyltransferase/sulfurtransferase
MGILDYFKPVPTITATDLKRSLREKTPGEYNLIDVRQPGEYERGHIPGARLMPVGDLAQHAGELDPGKPTIAY